MRSPPLVALVVLLVAVGPPLAAAGGPAPLADGSPNDVHLRQQSPGANDTDTNRTTPWSITLPTSAERRSGATRRGMDVAAAVATDRVRAVGRFEEVKLSGRLERAGSDDRRFELLQAEATAINAELDALRAAERAAVSSYASGEITAAELLDRLGRIDARAQALGTRIATVRRAGEAIRSAQIVSRAEELETRAAAIGGSLVELTRRTQSGEAAVGRVVVEAGPQTAVLTTVADETFYREALDVSARSSDAPTISLREAVDVFSRIYPRAFNDLDDIEAGGQRAAGLYYITIATRSGGQLTAYLDNRNQTVFREIYRVPLDRLPDGTTVEGRENGLSLTLNRSYPGGPVHVSVEDAETSDPVAATVLVGNETVGRVGADGSGWVPGSAWRNAYTVRTAGNRSVTVELPPAERPA